MRTHVEGEEEGFENMGRVRRNRIERESESFDKVAGGFPFF